jgi:aspartyl-tRNA(Asn)/glutamyl-tRNA(Gln) amidotransferase subunit A
VTGLERLSALELLAGYRERAFSPSETVTTLSARISALDPGLGAFTTLCLERAQAEAEASTLRWSKRTPCGALDGVPLAVKDLYDTAEVASAYGSAMFAGAIPGRDAEAVRRARSAGAIVLGKTQTHEFAWGITSVNLAMGTAHNPWDPRRIAGGSSGGSAVALAAELVPLALGTDTGGSIRIPAAFCGLAGLKPTFGRVSRAGIFPLAASLDHAGPMARGPADLELLLSVIAGRDPADAATELAPAEGAFSAHTAALSGLRVGLCPDLHLAPLDADVATAYAATVGRLARLGADLVELELPEAHTVLDIYAVVQRAEALHEHRQAGLYPKRCDDYGPDVRRWLELATTVELADYLDACRERERLRAGFARLFRDVELILTPVAACGPPQIGEDEPEHLGRRVALRELVMPYTVPQNLAGLPACALRAGFDSSGCPIGMQLTGPPWSEARVLGAARMLVAADPELAASRPPPHGGLGGG